MGDLKTASLDLPTVRGTIHVDFASEPGESFVLNVELPGNTEAVVCLPLLGGDRRQAFHDDKAVAARREGDFLVIPDVPAGRHRFELRP
ncbi:MAG TPA: alpha-L-rhamnosidase C-terminal domain-containing protein [Sedimentisphaerales bacterium]|nr:alpha-L-rhamnosidase C-terminal domain-containing protein [Sedimentisphaerales bacterium]